MEGSTALAIMAAVFVGLKMALVDVVDVPPLISLAVIASLLGASIGASLLARTPGISAVTRDRARA